MNYDNLSYGYKWLIEITLSFLVAMYFVLVAPLPDDENFKLLQFYGYQGVVFLIAELVKYIICFNYLGKVLKLIEQKYGRHSLGIVVNSFVGLSGLFFVVYAGWNLFPHAKQIYTTFNAEIIGIKHIWSSVWSGDKANITRFAFVGIAMPFACFYLPEIIMREWQKVKENRAFRQSFKEGRGGSAQWAGEPTLARFQAGAYINNKKILLGRSLFDDDPHTRVIGIDDDTHMITVGMTGSGKSTTVLLPNLATYAGSAIVLDPKGELANKTYYCRSNEQNLRWQEIQSPVSKHLINGRCFVLDPFAETKGLPLNCYNLLSEIDIDSDRVREMLSAISDGCVTPEKGDNVHFEELAKHFIEGMIAHVLSWYPKENHNLPFIFDLINGVDADLKAADPTKFNDLLYEMLKDDAAGGLPLQIASKILEMGDREKGSVLSTVTRSLKWVSDPAMRKHLVKSDFNFFGLNYRTVYIVLPDGLIKEQMRWLRSLIALSLTLVKNSPDKAEIPTLFVMDEFPRLGGKIDIISEGFGILRGYGIKLWAFLQDIGQLQKDYPDRWTSMLANSTVQVFGVNDLKTAQWVSDMLGAGTTQIKDNNKQTREVINPLLTPNEVMAKFGKTENRQFVKTVEGFPMRLERCSYKPLSMGKHGFQEFEHNALKGCFEDW